MAFPSALAAIEHNAANDLEKIIRELAFLQVDGESVDEEELS